jgi:predicted nucleic acid-binding protein
MYQQAARREISRVIDDRAARRAAEAHGLNCAGVLAVLAEARELNGIDALRPLFETLLSCKRFYKKHLLNALLMDYSEAVLD